MAGDNVVGFVRAGQIDILYGNKINQKASGKFLSLRAGTNSAGQIVWICGRATAPSGVTANGTDNTNVDAKFLPSACRP